MSDTKNTQATKNIFSRQDGAAKTGETHGGVWQDNNAPRRVRTALGEPVTVEERARSRPSRASRSSSSPRRSVKRRTVQVAAWVDQPVRDSSSTLPRRKA